jgi:hypothetical protein
MTDNNATTTTTETPNAADNIHRTPALDKMGLARCRKDNKLFSWRKGGSCKVCGARVEDAPAPSDKPKRGGRKAPAPATDSKPKRSGGRSAASKK